MKLFCRYLFSLQMKRDLTEGRLVCTENTGALLASHLVQCRFTCVYTACVTLKVFLERVFTSPAIIYCPSPHS